MNPMRFFVLTFATVFPTAVLPSAPSEAEDEYKSPYSVKFSHDKAELIGDIERGSRGDRHLEADVPFDEWYSPKTLKQFGSWGPRHRAYPAAPQAAGKPDDWLRERAIAVALRFEGYAYQHHHVLDWDPPADWPWKQTSLGHNGKGADCSNFVSFVYNQGFGIKMHSGIHELAEQREMTGPDGKPIRVERLNRPDSFEGWAKTLKPGDLLFITGRPNGPVTHVVLWIGSLGQSEDGVLLVLDSHDGGVKDANGTTIPCGIHLRPFRQNSWYAKNASHAIRVFGAK